MFGKSTQGSGSSANGKLGTFLGVFTPTILTILGVIMYLRLGWVTGQVGLVKTLAIVVIANLITLFTTLSFSSIATNFRVGVGGAYYIISRSLGLEFGGAIGLPLFLSQAFSVTLYAFGLAESLRILFPAIPLQLTAVLITLGVGGLALKGAGLALRAQVPILVLIAISLVVFVAGAFLRPRVDLTDLPEAQSSEWRALSSDSDHPAGTNGLAHALNAIRPAKPAFALPEQDPVVSATTGSLVPDPTQSPGTDRQPPDTLQSSRTDRQPPDTLQSPGTDRQPSDTLQSPSSSDSVQQDSISPTRSPQDTVRSTGQQPPAGPPPDERDSSPPPHARKLAPSEAQQSSVPTTPFGFWIVFAVFFPAVTGIMAGLGLSGDLRDPIRSIPRGSLAAMLLGFAIYLAIPFVLVKGATPAALVGDPLIWTRIAFAGAILVLPGLWGAIFSSAVGSVLGAPRTLQALSDDGLVPKFLGKVSGKGGEPIVGLIVTLAIALGAIGLGNLNAVAPVVSMFFLTVYGMVNLVAAMESLSGDSSWRPRLRIPWAISLLGAIGCFTVMFLISAKAAVAAIIIEILLWMVLARRARKARWGDIRRDIYESIIRWALMRLLRHPMTPRNWRPHVLVFVDNAERRLDLIRFGTWFSQGRGVVTVCELVVGEVGPVTTEVSHRDREERIQKILNREALPAFGEVDIVADVISGISSVAQANGIAGLDSNTIVLGWPRATARLIEFLEVVKSLEHLKKSVILARIQPGLIPRAHEERIIHVWWGGLERNGDLMLLLAHLITRNPEWRNSSIRIMSIASSEMVKERTELALAKLIPAIRIDAEVEVTLMAKGQTVRQAINQRSAEADLVFLGLSPPKASADLPAYSTRLFDLCENLRTVFFVKNSSLFVGRLVQTSDEIGSNTVEDEKPPPR